LTLQWTIQSPVETPQVSGTILMLYLKKPLTGWFMQYTAEQDITMYNLYASILLDWAKKKGFKCGHKFADDKAQDKEGRQKCLLCGDRVK